MTEANHYVPILKTKAGECGALKSLKEFTWALLTPLLEVHEVPWDYTKDAPAKTIEKHVQDVRDQVAGAIPREAVVYLDGNAVADAGAASDGTHTLTFIAAGLQTAGIRVIPVLGLGRSAPYMEAAERLARERSQACIRVDADDIARTAGQLDGDLQAVLKQIGLTRSHCALVIDLGSIAPNAVGPLVLAVVSVIGALVEPESWGRLVIAASGMPQDLSEIAANEVSSVPRAEWTLWKALVSRAGSLRRVPCFSDYAVTNPALGSIDPRMMKMAAKIKYTTTDEWLIARSFNVRDYGYEQAHEVCGLIRNHSEFSGVAFSEGDRWISDCADRVGGPGGGTQWVSAGTSHHLEFVANQVANYPVPSAGS